ncbi:glycerol dehydrogenase [Bacillus coahuilensis m2-6]|uniref:iron-containing alcohol dehydrogenase family protein n=1 Tax=Bacillus coahuilensis TaxID=408580 RepID=UPI0007505F79|nr:iron-containing alcohol dehydrogenase family protein [Bacillus coahuilensis]KUP08250.1 glycerol dehydrogenase [Bacillus coahuilensis m2-6]
MQAPITSIPIPSILEIQYDTILKLDDIMKKHPFKEILILMDEYSYKTYSSRIQHTISSFSYDMLELSPGMDIKDLISKAFELKRYDAVMSIGGGTIIDYGKYIAFSRRSPFISIPTSPSNDGFASSNCSLLIDGKKTTVPARVPYGIIVDLNIIKTAPSSFILAGVGDLMSNITALYDWEFEEKNGKGHVDAFAYMLSKKATNSFTRTPMTDLQDPIFLKELISSLTMGGISTAISGNSAPISGSEHLVSHALEKLGKSEMMHGIQVGIATYLMALVQEHRSDRMVKVFTRTGFFDYVKTLQIPKALFIDAIDLAPSIKPTRYTYLHVPEYQQKAKNLIASDAIFNEILV